MTLPYGTDMYKKSSYEYGIFHSSGTCCTYWKKDEEDNQSTFNLFVAPARDGEKKQIWCQVDSELIGKGNLHSTSIEDVLKSYNLWYDGGDNELDLKAQRGITNCLHSELRVGDISTEYKLKGGVNLGLFHVEGSGKQTKNVRGLS